MHIRKQALLAASVISALLITLVFAIAFGSRPPGPWTSNAEFTVTLPLATGTTATWGTVIPENPTQQTITVEAIEPVNAHGLQIVGIGVDDPAIDGGIGTAEGFPPAGAAIRDIPGTVLAPGTGGGGPYLQVLIGIRLAGSADGSIDGLRVRYRISDTVYETVLPLGLRVSAAHGD